MSRFLLAVAAVSALVTAGADATPPNPLDGPRLLAEVNILSRLVPLQLTDDQIDRILAACDQAALAQQATLNSDAGRALQTLRAQLLQGQMPTLAAMEGLRLLYRDIQQASASPGSADLFKALEDILTPKQMALLATQGPGGLAGDKARRYAAEQVIDHLGPYLEVTDDEWPDVSSRLAASLASGVLDPDRRPDVAADIAQFLDRLRATDSPTRNMRHEELVEELCALLPDGVPVAWQVPLEPPEPAAGPREAENRRDRERERVLSIFALPDTPRVLRELKRARTERGL